MVLFIVSGCVGTMKGATDVPSTNFKGTKVPFEIGREPTQKSLF